MGNDEWVVGCVGLGFGGSLRGGVRSVWVCGYGFGSGGGSCCAVGEVFFFFFFLILIFGLIVVVVEVVLVVVVGYG